MRWSAILFYDHAIPEIRNAFIRILFVFRVTFVIDTYFFKVASDETLCR